MDRKYQVFISSTFDDLKEERVEIMEALINLGHIPIGMELFNAADDTQWGVIKRRIKESDYYVLILSGRYGSLDSDGIGFTEKEYDYAIKTGIPVISFVRTASKIEKLDFEFRESDNKHKLKAFRDKVSGRLYKPWDDKYDLSKKFFLAFAELIRERPQSGWIKAETQEGISKKQFDSIFSENGTLKEQVLDIQKKLSTANEKLLAHTNLESKSKLVTEQLKHNSYDIIGINMNGLELVGIFGSFLSFETTVDKALRGIQEFIKNKIGERPDRDLMRNIIGIFSGMGLTEHKLESHTLHEEDSHKGDLHIRDKIEIIEYVKPTTLFHAIYIQTSIKDFEHIFDDMDSKTSGSLRKRLSDLSDFTGYASDSESYDKNKKQQIDTIITEFLSEYTWSSEQEKQNFFSMDFMSDQYALSELLSKAKKVVRVQEPHAK